MQCFSMILLPIIFLLLHIRLRTFPKRRKKSLVYAVLVFSEVIFGCYIAGSLPEYGDTNLTAEACLQTADHICEKSIYITITNCGKFYVYYLQNTTQNSSYCFGKVFSLYFYLSDLTSSLHLASFYEN